jgi:hypothetical protein
LATVSTAAVTKTNNVLDVHGLGKTERRDAWWVEPVLTVAVLVLFSIYAFWSASQNAHYEFGPYLSPFYSPNLKHWFPGINFSPAFLILWIPLGFRGTCYFYRRAYYRSFFWDPPACSVGENRKGNYTGETKFPFVLQNLHRFFFYAAFVLTVLHWTHLVQAFIFDGNFGVGVGSLVYLLDVVFLTLYTFSCHSFRHLLGGKLDCFSCSNFTQHRYNAWKKQSVINENHMVFAWISLFTVGFTDLYIRMCSMGIWQDFRLF